MDTQSVRKTRNAKEDRELKEDRNGRRSAQIAICATKPPIEDETPPPKLKTSNKNVKWEATIDSKPPIYYEDTPVYAKQYSRIGCKPAYQAHQAQRRAAEEAQQIALQQTAPQLQADN